MNCKQCKFWLEMKPIQVIEEGITFGNCRRFPPVLSFDVNEPTIPDFVWPNTCSDEWCGEGKIF